MNQGRIFRSSVHALIGLVAPLIILLGISLTNATADAVIPLYESSGLETYRVEEDFRLGLVAIDSLGTNSFAMYPGGGIFKSSDSGGNYTLNNSFLLSNPTSMSAFSNDKGPGLHISRICNLWRSSEDRKTFYELNPGVPTSDIACYKQVTSSIDGYVIAAVASGSQTASNGRQDGIFLSRDAGLTWTSYFASSNALGTNKGCGGPCNPSHSWISVAMSDNGDNIIAVADDGSIALSRDQGFEWISGKIPASSWNYVAIPNLSTDSIILSDGVNLYSWVPRFTPTTEGINWEKILTRDNGTIKSTSAVLSNDAPQRINTAPVLTWKKVLTSANADITVALSSSGVIYQSTDSFQTWRKVTDVQNNTYDDVSLSRASKILVADSTTKIFTSRNPAGALISTPLIQAARIYDDVALLARPTLHLEGLDFQNLATVKVDGQECSVVRRDTYTFTNPISYGIDCITPTITTLGVKKVLLTNIDGGIASVDVQFAITVNLNSNGGTFVLTRFFVGSALTKPVDPTYIAHPSWQFLGWFDSLNKEINWITFSPVGPVTLKAKWGIDCGGGIYKVVKAEVENLDVCTEKITVPTVPEPVVIIPTYRVNYLANGVDVTSVFVDYNGYTSGGKITVPAQIPVRTGHTFLGWNIAANGTGTKFVAGSLITVDSSDIALYAQWQINSYTLAFNANGGQALGLNSLIRDYGSTAVVPSITPDHLRIGHTFLGWNSAANGTGKSYSPGDTYTYSAADTTLWAQWRVNSYTVAYDANESKIGKAPSSATQEYNSAMLIKSPSAIFKKSGYTFKGWNTAKDGSGTSYAVGESLVVGATNQSLYANWIPNTYRVKFLNTYRDQLADSQFVTGGVIANAPVPPARTGYTLKGWSNNPSKTSMVSFPYTPGVARNVTLYAVWVKK